MKVDALAWRQHQLEAAALLSLSCVCVSEQSVTVSTACVTKAQRAMDGAGVSPRTPASAAIKVGP